MNTVILRQDKKTERNGKNQENARGVSLDNIQGPAQIRPFFMSW